MATHDTLLNKKSLAITGNGMSLALTVPWYRSLWVSSVTSINVWIDGAEVAQDKISFRLNDQSWPMSEVPNQWETLWFMQDRAYLDMDLGKPGVAGEDHEITIHVEMRLPYMQIKPGFYLPNIVHQVVTLKVQA
ncbi:MAG: hypothetical protein RL612_838 [Actinomycetota bacterium]|jgi:hypothetical protein